MATAYLRRDLPDGYVEALASLRDQLFDGAIELETGSCSRDLADRYHATIDGKRLMLRAADRIDALVRATPQRNGRCS